jgi:ribosomal protein S18 acetylase RimI-like enzyme
VQDRQSLRQIACDTAFMGLPAEAFCEDREVLADILISYFVNFESESCFVVEADKKVAGYLIGAKDTFILENTFARKMLLPLLGKIFIRGTVLKKKNLLFFYYLLRSFFRGELDMPQIHKDYPATLHINMAEGFRGAGAGSQLIASYLAYLKEQKVSGVYLSTLSDNAAVFFAKQGFQVLHTAKRSYYRNILNKDVTCYIYGKKL